MEETNTKPRLRVSRPLLVVWTVLITLFVTAGGFLLLLGQDGMAVLQGWFLIRYAFVETDADLTKAADGALEGMVEGLGDRWSYYVDRAGYLALKERRANRYIGIGVTVNYASEAGLTVISVTDDGPAAQAGIVAGDIITGVDGIDLSGQTRYEGAQLIGGTSGDKQTLTILHTDGSVDEIEVTLSEITTEVVTGQLLENGMGLVTIRNFNTNCDGAFEETVQSLAEQGAAALLFDLRNNGGGYVDELTEMLDFLLPEGAVFQTDPRWGFASAVHSDPECIDLPFGVLVNSNSYSAAELFAAQLRESVGAPIVGEATSGKGYSQKTIGLFNGGAIGLSTARYMTGGGVSLIGTGIIPDVQISLNEAESALLKAEKLETERDPQLQALIAAMSAG